MKIFKWTIGILGVLLISGILYAYLKADALVESYLKKSIPKNVELKYSSLSVNIFRAELRIFDVELALHNESNGVRFATVQSKKMELDGFNYWQYFKNDFIQIRKIHIQDPITTIHPALRHHIADSLQLTTKSVRRKMELKQFEISNGQLYMMKDGADSIRFSAMKIHLNLSDIVPIDSLGSGRMPFLYEDLKFEMSELYISMGNYEDLFVAHSAMYKHKIELADLSVKSKFSKDQMLSVLPEEREHFDIQIPLVVLDSIEFEIKQKLFYMYASMMSIQNAKLDIYLDKRLKDRTRFRPMYSKLIRDLPFKLDIDSTRFDNWNIVYDEKHETNLKAGRVSFENLNANIMHLTNLPESNKTTQIRAHAQIMGQGMASIDWKFDVQNTREEFTVTGKVSDFKAGATNQFLNSFVKTSLSGEIEQVYFNIAGDDIRSSGDFKMKYNDLNIAILKDDRSEKHQIKSFIGNLLLDNGTNADAEGFRHGQISVIRNQRRPFFNYLWLNVKDGIENTIRINNRKQGPR
ncbi:MAG: hypothetical protein IPO62_01165 [Saprospiraceae bacterium]|nr:hypothetical protein [Saprospiraceae bacterium]